MRKPTKNRQPNVNRQRAEKRQPVVNRLATSTTSLQMTHSGLLQKDPNRGGLAQLLPVVLSCNSCTVVNSARIDSSDDTVDSCYRCKQLQNLVLPCRLPQVVRLALMASLSSYRANRMSYSNRSAPTLAENCLSCSALRLMR